MHHHTPRPTIDDAGIAWGLSLSLNDQREPEYDTHHLQISGPARSATDSSCSGSRVWCERPALGGYCPGFCSLCKLCVFLPLEGISTCGRLASAKLAHQEKVEADEASFQDRRHVTGIGANSDSACPQAHDPVLLSSGNDCMSGEHSLPWPNPRL